MKCPECGLENPEIAQLCDCGHKFKAGEVTMTNEEYKRKINIVIWFDIIRVIVYFVLLCLCKLFFGGIIGAIIFNICLELLYQIMLKQKNFKDKFIIRESKYKDNSY